VVVSRDVEFNELSKDNDVPTVKQLLNRLFTTQSRFYKNHLHHPSQQYQYRIRIRTTTTTTVTETTATAAATMITTTDNSLCNPHELRHEAIKGKQQNGTKMLNLPNP
jgi:hypothetical protein